ncbi:MAG: hypothetical protein CMJ41_03280 [Phycisphaerae bacterium]|nr:hypothetical protein [Phycisphaerae bacterium]|tara:strand:+ start:7697 stop:8062 length:366 start_codon:yes stop_codon:yes gene_type:complete
MRTTNAKQELRQNIKKRVRKIIIAYALKLTTCLLLFNSTASDAACSDNLKFGETKMLENPYYITVATLMISLVQMPIWFIIGLSCAIIASILFAYQLGTWNEKQRNLPRLSQRKYRKKYHL